MTEQDLLNYEGAHYCLLRAHAHLVEITTQLRACGSVNFSRVGKSQYNGERLTELISKKDEAQRCFDEIGNEMRRASEAYQKIMPLLDTQERAFAHQRYIIGASCKDIASLFNIPLENVYNIRKSILQKIERI